MVLHPCDVITGFDFDGLRVITVLPDGRSLDRAAAWYKRLYQILEVGIDGAV
jgi:hypothetical protein